MRRLAIIWLLHWIITVGGWYLVGALEQGVADSTGAAPPVLVLMYVFMQLLAFPVVIAAMWIAPGQIGGFWLESFLLFALLAAINSALIVSVASWLIRALRRRNPHVT